MRFRLAYNMLRNYAFSFFKPKDIVLKLRLTTGLTSSKMLASFK